MRRRLSPVAALLLAACGDGTIIDDDACAPEETLYLGECRRSCPCPADEACLAGLCYGRDCGEAVCDATQVCIGGACVFAGCTATGCQDGYCDPNGLVCVECLDDAHCAAGTICDAVQRACVCAQTAATEVICSDGVDDDCDGAIDCTDADCPDGAACGPNGASCDGDACQCPNPDPNESACDNALDDDCDGAFDCADPDCADGTGCGSHGLECSAGACLCPTGLSTETTCGDGADDDCDGDVDCDDTDCDSVTCGTNGLVCSAGACICPTGASTETRCDDSVDDDCDGEVDCVDADCDGLACGPNGLVCTSGGCDCPGGPDPGATGRVVRKLATALSESSVWRDFSVQRAHLSDEDLSSLRQARTEFWRRIQSEEFEDAAGTTVFRRCQYMEAYLAKLEEKLSANGKAYWDAFGRVDRIIENAMGLLAHLLVLGDPLLLPRFERVRWFPPERFLRVWVDIHPLALRRGYAVALGPSSIPSGLLGLILGRSWSASQGKSEVMIDIEVLDGGWEAFGDDSKTG
ncbi:hypothetical protein ACFL6C_12910 [Myxococcota bacterium]